MDITVTIFSSKVAQHSWKSLSASLHVFTKIQSLTLSLSLSITHLSSDPSLIFLSSFFCFHRPLHSDDGSLLPEEKDRILRHPDLHAVLHDCHPVAGLLLAESGVCPCQDGVRSVTTLQLILNSQSHVTVKLLFHSAPRFLWEFCCRSPWLLINLKMNTSITLIKMEIGIDWCRRTE